MKNIFKTLLRPLCYIMHIRRFNSSSMKVSVISTDLVVTSMEEICIICGDIETRMMTPPVIKDSLSHLLYAATKVTETT